MATPRTLIAWAWFGLAAAAVLVLLQRHAAHVREYLPFLLILACPLMHMFMHRGHGEGHAHHDHRGDDRTA